MKASLSDLNIAVQILQMKYKELEAKQTQIISPDREREMKLLKSQIQRGGEAMQKRIKEMFK